jgi:hypothetical protein
MAEVWCVRCPEEAEREVHGEAYCHNHALVEDWKANSPSWNPERTIPQRVAPVTESELRLKDGNR